MSGHLRILATALLCFCARSALADPIHAIDGGAYWHHDSGWIFPERIGEFVRVGVPQDVDGSRDAVAYYASEAKGVRTIAAVDVYPADSATGPTTLASAKAAIEASPHTRLKSEGPFNVSAERKMAGTRVSYVTEHDGAPSDSTRLYFFDAKEWFVKIRITVPAAKSSTLKNLDAFVRGQRWETLAATRPLMHE